MSGDLLVEGDFLHHMADHHRARDAAVTVMVYQGKVSSDDESSKGRLTGVVDYIANDSVTNRLLFLQNSSNLDADFVKIPKTLFRKFPNICLHTSLHDANFYMFSRWTLEILEPNKEIIQSIRTHFIPYLVKSQYKSGLLLDSGIAVENLNSNFLSPEVYRMSTSRHYDPDDIMKCYFFKFPDEDGKKYCQRVDDIEGFMEVNRTIAEGSKGFQPSEPRGHSSAVNFIARSAKISAQTSIPAGSVVGEGTQIGDRVGVKKSIVGKHCKLSSNSKLINSVIFDHVTVEDSAKIQNSIIGNNCYIEQGAEITDCVLGAGTRIVAAGTILRGKKIVGR
eukprot:TRINITY_DN610_c0_g1_i1.p1 TRINITY_DN610_c0_g1~~TRINITY_DN610_c0_g1_i1.p1  ORF type:complete len:335 (-),score=65.06 TRINITY_DN610_c0_g1_i1:141-1145(-)